MTDSTAPADVIDPAAAAGPAGDARPMTVLCSLLSRADSSPLGVRRRDAGTVVDDAGVPIPDPADAPGSLAFEKDPNIGFEKWGDYWRKVHGERFMHANRSGGAGDGLLAYDQLHRVPGGPTSHNPPPYRPPLDDGGELFDTVLGHIPAYGRPQWDGMAYLGFESPDGLAAVLGQDSVQSKIIPEHAAVFRELAPVLTVERVVLGGAARRDPIVLVWTFRRRAALSRAEFQAEWAGAVAERWRTAPAAGRHVRRHAQLHAIGPEQEGQPLWHPAGSRIDGISLTAFATMADVESFLVSDDARRLEEDMARIADPADWEYWTALSFPLR